MGKIGCYVMGLINAPIDQNIMSWAIEVHVYAIVLTVRPSSTSWELHQLVDEEGRMTRAFQRVRSILKVGK